jgi:hypothetical protein
VLLIVGGYDDVVIGLNKRAYQEIRAEKELKIVPRATHLFEEPGALEEVARLKCGWTSVCGCYQETGVRRSLREKRASIKD